MNLASYHPLLPYWSELDRLILLGGELGRYRNKEPGASLWPWESDNPSVQDVWEQLTRPENLSALKDWGRDLEQMNDYAFSCTAVAIETCLLRSYALGGTRTAAACTPEALIAYMLKYAGRISQPRG